VVTGKIVRFDVVRGYGFAAPDSGGEDVFVHVNDLEVDKEQIAPGVAVEFDVEDGDRGLKASRVRVLGQPGAALPDRPAVRDYDDELGDVLSSKEFVVEVTETLLAAAPTLTADQIVSVRQQLIKLAVAHGWVDS
jgi:CspA family cold shock protein